MLLLKHLTQNKLKRKIKMLYYYDIGALNNKEHARCETNTNKSTTLHTLTLNRLHKLIEDIRILLNRLEDD